MLIGSFSGIDFDGDGWFYGYELMVFELYWLGNCVVEVFSYGFDDCVGLEFNLVEQCIDYLVSVNLVGDSQCLFSFESMGWLSYQIFGVVIDECLGLVLMSWEFLWVMVVVLELQSLVLMVVGLGFIGGWCQCC